MNETIEQLHFLNGVMAYRNADYPTSLKDCSHSLDLNSKGAMSAGAFIMRSLAEFRRGNDDSAIADLEKAREIEPENPELHHVFAQIAARHDDLQHARTERLKEIDLHNKAIDRFPQKRRLLVVAAGPTSIRRSIDNP